MTKVQQNLFGGFNMTAYYDKQAFNKKRELLEEIPDYNGFQINLKKLDQLKEEFEKYKPSLEGCCLNLAFSLNIEELIECAGQCLDSIDIIKKGVLKHSLMALQKGEISRTEVEVYFEKIKYYMKKIKMLKVAMGVHVVCLPEGISNLKALKHDFNQIYIEIKKKGRLGEIYRLMHSKFKYIFEGCTSDLRYVENIKQAKYIKLFIDMEICKKQLKMLFDKAVDDIKMEAVSLEGEKFIEKTEKCLSEMQLLLNLRVSYNEKLIRLLKKNVFLIELNCYDEVTYEKIRNIAEGIYYLKAYKEAEAYKDNILKVLKLLGVDNSEKGWQNIRKLRENII